MKDWSLNHNQLRFIAEYLAVLPRNATMAYQRVYDTSYDVANAASARLMADPRVQAEVARREEMLRTDLELTAADVLREIFLVASADPRELTEFHVGACRHCHGDGHKFQRTPAEFERDLEAYIAARKADKARAPDPLGLEFDVKGGIGFNPYRDPAPDCPECFGKGEGYERFKDTRTLSPAAARLYEGTKRTRDGVEIKIRSREKSLDLAAQHLGIARRAVELTGKNGGPVQTAGVSIAATTTDPIEAANLYRNLIGS